MLAAGSCAKIIQLKHKEIKGLKPCDNQFNAIDRLSLDNAIDFNDGIYDPKMKSLVNATSIKQRNL